MVEDEVADSEGESEPPLPSWAQATARISPCSTLAALAAYPTDASTPREVINGLINNICYQQQQSKDNVGQMQTTLEGQQALIDDLTMHLAEAEGAIDLAQPDGFEDNNGRIYSLIPIGGGMEVIPKWIQKRNDGKVALRAGKEEEEPTYVTKLYTDPDYLGDHPIQAMAPWLKHMLASSEGENHIVHAALLDLNKWGLQADAKRFKHYSDAHVRVQSEMHLLEAKEAFYRDKLYSIVHHMEATRVMDKLGHLQAAEEGEQVGRRSVNGNRFKRGQGHPL